MKKFRTINQKDQAIDLFQDNVAQAFEDILPKEIINGVLLKDIDLLNAVINQVEHKLGRDPLGYFPVKIRNGFAVLSDNDGSQPSKFLYISSSVTCNVDMWVF